MIERCSKRRMLLAVAILGLVSAIIIILESTHLRTHEIDIHESHPILKEKIKPEEKCWTRESVDVLEACHHCTKDEIFKHSPIVCVATGYKEKIKCASGNVTYRACHQVAWVEERRFWIFESVMLLSGCVSATFVFLRQKQLDHIVYKRIQKQIATGV